MKCPYTHINPNPEEKKNQLAMKKTLINQKRKTLEI
jgi:hypothetical protein